MDRLRFHLLAAMGLAAATGCIGGKDTVAVDSGSTDNSSTPDDTGEEIERTCSDVDVLTRDEALQLEWGSDQTWLVCVDQDGDCPATDELNSWELLAEALGEHPEPEFCGWYGEFVCGPEAAITEACCYEMTVEQVCEGRPLTVEGLTRRAEVRRGAAWLAEAAPSLAGLSLAERRLLARTWLDSARDEHASVAAFHRFALQLMALGAPPELLLATQRAAADEVVHARLAFGLASAFAGSPLSAGPLDVAGAIETELSAVTRAHLRDACINETLACAQAAAARDATTDPAVRAVLDRIVEDETRHAALAWRTLRWLVDQDPSLRDVVSEELAAARPPATDHPGVPSHGRLDGATLSAVSADALERVVRPCAEALLSPR